MRPKNFSCCLLAFLLFSQPILAGEPLVLGKGKGLFKIGPLLAEDSFENLENWVVQLDQGKNYPKSQIVARGGKLDCLVPGSGCTIWFKEKLQTRITISYEVLCPTTEPAVKGVGVSDVNNFWMARDPSEGALGLFDSARYTGDFRSYNQMEAYYASTGGGRNTTTRMRRYPRQVDSEPVVHLALKDKDKKPDYLITPNEVMKVQLVAYDDVVQYIVDGQLVYEISSGDQVELEGVDEQGKTISLKGEYDLARFPFYEEGYFGFRMVRTHHLYSNYRVHTLLPD